ncbi:MAG: hypothetical protein WA688_04930 [Thermoplasmata archaeon]
MFAIPNSRIAEMSRPNFARQLDEYARLEYPREDAISVRQLALEAVKESPAPPRVGFRFFRWRATPTEGAAAKT